MAELQRTLRLDETEQHTLAEWDVTSFGKSVAKLVSDQIRKAAQARDVLVKGGRVGSDEIAAVRTGLATVRFWASAVPKGELTEELSAAQQQTTQIDGLLTELESLLAGS